MSLPRLEECLFLNANAHSKVSCMHNGGHSPKESPGVLSNGCQLLFDHPKFENPGKHLEMDIIATSQCKGKIGEQDSNP